MATQTTLLIIALALTLSVQGALCYNNFNCEDLNMDACAYAVDSLGKRCVLEKHMISNEFTCATSDIVADNQKDLIETEECVSACGVDRKALGISSDSLLDRGFIGQLCSRACYHDCPNIVDLYFNLAAGEGIFLPKLCVALRKSNGRREMAEVGTILSSGNNQESANVPTSQSQEEIFLAASKDAIFADPPL